MKQISKLWALLTNAIMNPLVMILATMVGLLIALARCVIGKI